MLDRESSLRVCILDEVPKTEGFQLSVKRKFKPSADERTIQEISSL